MKPQDHVEKYVKAASVHIGPDLDDRLLQKMQDAYYRAGSCTPARRHPDYWGLVFESRFVRLVFAALVLLSFIVLVSEFGTLLTGSNVAWADVNQRFQFVPFFYASIYMKEGTLAQPQQFELWMGKGGYVRMRAGAQVIFGRNGQMTKAFDVRQRSEVNASEVNPMAMDIIRMLGTPNEFSFQMVIESISGGKLVDITPTMNTQAGIGRELVVFDARSALTPGWVRIYALRQTKLPVGLRIWDPGAGFVVDAIITYSKEQPAISFDPDAFSARLHGTENETSLAYLFLQDSGGPEMMPEEPPR